MDISVQTALIAMGSACIGALIPSLFSYLGKQKEYRNDRKAKLEEIKRKVYNDYIEALQTMINNGNRDAFLVLQAKTNRILLFAGSTVSNLANKHFNLMIQRTLHGNPLTMEEMEQFETEIFNAMREDLGVAQEEIGKVSMVKADF